MSLTPDRSPLLAGDIVCYTCGEILHPKVVMGPRGVDHIEYQCNGLIEGKRQHEPYRVESTIMTSGEMRPVRPDGSAVKL